MKKFLKFAMITATVIITFVVIVIILAVTTPSISSDKCDSLQKNVNLYNHSYDLAIANSKLCDLEYKGKYSFPLKEWEKVKMFVEKFGPTPTIHETVNGECYTTALIDFIQNHVKYPNTVERRSCGIPSMSPKGWLYGCSFYSKNSFNLLVKTHRIFIQNKTTYKVVEL